ncbi:TetR/AcrR family transcriptional regulator [Pantanalinema sp. GBBB05]|uniref:TetR/AcrR family transcriptional regulator n=1 Tax=Pantanalinema sp. GBBB05 TaxID=2604139 RepID=UPI003D81622D
MAECNSSAPAIAQFATMPQYTPKQEAILRGAVRVFLQSGYAGTSMDRVAAEAGVSKQTIYSHFQDKEGLFTALMERMTIRRFQTFLGMERLQGEPALLLRQFAEGFLNHIVDDEYVALLRLIIAESVRFPELAKLYGRTVIQTGRQLMTEFFQQHPELGFTDAEAVAHIFIGSLVSYVLAQEIFYGKEGFPLERDRLVESLLALLLEHGG